MSAGGVCMLVCAFCFLLEVEFLDLPGEEGVLDGGLVGGYGFCVCA